MDTKKNLYHYEETLERCINRIKNSNLPLSVIKKIDEFQRDCASEGAGPARILRYLNDLPKIARSLNKDFEKATVEDIKRVVRDIEKLELSEVSKLEIKRTLKKFYKWLNGGEDYPESVRWLKTSEKRCNGKLPEDLISEEEIKTLITTAWSVRDRALISLLWETGCRAGEILTLQIKHVSFEDNVTRVTVHGKTGARRIPIIDSTPYIAEWMENHPFKDNPNASLWLGIGNVGKNQMMTYAAFRKMLADVARKAKIKKRVNPHNFRHSRSTFLAKHFTESQMTQYLGWVTGSDMPATYVHLSGRDLDEAVFKLNGEKPKTEEKFESSLAPKKCPRCTMVNKAIGKFCTRCGAVLDIETAIKVQDEVKKIDTEFSKLLQNKDVQEFLIKKMVEMGIK